MDSKKAALILIKSGNPVINPVSDLMKFGSDRLSFREIFKKKFHAKRSHGHILVINKTII